MRVHLYQRHCSSREPKSDTANLVVKVEMVDETAEGNGAALAAAPATSSEAGPRKDKISLLCHNSNQKKHLL
jgi:hypothetical protein